MNDHDTLNDAELDTVVGGAGSADDALSQLKKQFEKSNEAARETTRIQRSQGHKPGVRTEMRKNHHP